jgi:hypothetical protein
LSGGSGVWPVMRHTSVMIRVVSWVGLVMVAAGACGSPSKPPVPPRGGDGAEATSGTMAEGRGERRATWSDGRRPLVGVSWAAFQPEDYAHPERHLDTVRRLGFEVVTLVPTYTYAGLNHIEHRSAPSFDALSDAIAAALTLGLRVVVKPHLDPPMYQYKFDALSTSNRSWRAQCPWRGYFDVDPMSDAYLDGLMVPTLDAIERALERAGTSPAHADPVRLDLGSELMNSTVHQPQRWFELAARMRHELQRRGLEGRVHLSHNFSHHFQIAEDFVLRMDAAARRALARYIEALDGLALSQYMDLTVAMPEGERGARLPTRDEVAQALLDHERAFKQDILGEHLGLTVGQVPALHIGEFGIGVGGLSHPNVWEGELDDDAREALGRQVARGHAGLLTYLAGEGTAVRSAVLWVTGGTYDVFGWMRDTNGLPEVMDGYRSFFEERND